MSLPPSTGGSFDAVFRDAFARRHASLFRYLDRLSGDPALAADLAQETFVRLYRRGSMPDNLPAWLVTVAMNLFRNERTRARRRRDLLSGRGAVHLSSEAATPPDVEIEIVERREEVRVALDALSERDRQLLLLRSEGYSYRDIAKALQLNYASVGTLLARARAAFREALSERRRTPG